MCKCLDQFDCNCEEIKNGIKIEITSKDEKNIENFKKIVELCKQFCSCC